MHLRSKSISTSLLLAAFLAFTPSKKAQDALFCSQSSFKIALQSHSTELPKSLSRKFRRDAARLALRLTAQQENLRYQTIQIPKDLKENIYQILSNIYLNDKLAQSLAKCNIHTFPNPSIDHFKVIFDKNIAWAAPLREGITETNNERINDLLDEYDLVIENHEHWTDQEDVIVIRSKEPLNMAALANEFYNIEGIIEIDLGIPDVGGNDITLSRLANGWQIEYTLKFGGTYIPGKGKQHTWTYKASDNGTFEYLSEKGDTVPSYMKCSSASIASKK